MPSTVAQAGYVLTEKVNFALDQFRLGVIGAQRKQNLVDEAFSQYRSALATTSAIGHQQTDTGKPS